MATETISLTLEAYERLRRERRPHESCSQVAMRATWPDSAVTAAELLERWATTPPAFTEAELDAVERAKAASRPPEDKWRTP